MLAERALCSFFVVYFSIDGCCKTLSYVSNYAAYIEVYLVIINYETINFIHWYFF